MDIAPPADFGALWSQDRVAQNQAFGRALEATNQPVGWAYEVWDQLLENLRHKDNHNRAIGAQVLCNLAKSDPGNRLLRDFPALFAVTRDERFVTARHCLQSLWKVGLAGRPQRQMLVDALAARYFECAAEKNCTLIRYDIIQALQRVYDATGDEGIKIKALDLVAQESDLKYRKKYATLWKGR